MRDFADDREFGMMYVGTGICMMVGQPGKMRK